MKEVEYYNSGTRNGYLELAKAMSKAMGLPVGVEKNTFVFSPSLATGRMVFFELSEGLSMTIMDCIFHKAVKFRHTIVAGSDNYKILFTVGDQPLHFISAKGRTTMLGDTLAGSVLFFTSYTVSPTLHIKAGQALKMVLFHVKQNWVSRYLLRPALPVQANWLKALVNGELPQFVADLDLKGRELLDDIFAAKGPPRILSRLLEGCTYQLMAMLCNNLVIREAGEKHIISDDALRVGQLICQIAQNPEEPLMTLEKAAAFCMMSRTKFVGLFKTVSGKNYGHFLLDFKMERAKVLLEQGRSVMDVGYNIGYAHISPFIKAFRLHYGLTPRAYQNSLKDPQALE